MQRWSEADFERLSWHDDTLYSVRFEIGDSARGDWRSDLVLDLDHIVEWVRGSAGSMRFRVAPATLVFHDATDLRIALDWGDSGQRTALSEPQIDAITRAPVKDQKICLDRPYYRWRIAFSWPSGGALEFGASGFTQTLRATPTLLDDQRLPPRQPAVTASPRQNATRKKVNERVQARSGEGMSKRAFDKIKAGLQDAIAIARGEADASTYRVHIPAEVDVKAIRRKLGMTQAEFARSFGFGLDAVQNWEQGRRRPEGAALAFLKVIDREPDAVRRALAA